MRPQKDDPRLSRGLQLLQSKIAVLEDLSDQVEKQFSQLSELLEIKAKNVQSRIQEADQKLEEIRNSMSRSLEVAEIFQDRIPHQEIVERQNTIKYVKAARMAHQGVSLDEIAASVDLSRGEIEMIANVNRSQLQFSESDLPEWVRKDLGIEMPGGTSQFDTQVLASAAQVLPRVSDHPKTLALSEIGDRFRQAVTEPSRSSTHSLVGHQAPRIEMPKSEVSSASATLGHVIPQKEVAKTSAGKPVEIQKVVFPRIDVTQHLS